MRTVSLCFWWSFLVAHVLAHYRFTSLILNGNRTEEYLYVRNTTNYYFPITNVNSIDMRCNVGGANGNNTQTATVTAGDTVGFGTDVEIFHTGVLNVYMAKTPPGVPLMKYDGSGENWFKIYQIPALTDGGKSISFPTYNQSEFTFPIPETINAGEYLLRIEHIALHLALDLHDTEFYVSCAQLNVTGGGNATPSLVSIPGVYTDTDPGIFINIYHPIPTTYVQPGPPVFAG